MITDVFPEFDLNNSNDDPVVLAKSGLASYFLHIKTAACLCSPLGTETHSSTASRHNQIVIYSGA